MECDKCRLTIGPSEVVAITLIQACAWAAIALLILC